MSESKLTLNGIPYSLTFSLSDKLSSILTLPLSTDTEELKLLASKYESTGDSITFEFIDTCENDVQKQGILKTYNGMARKAIVASKTLNALDKPLTVEAKLESLDSLLVGAVKVAVMKVKYKPIGMGVKTEIGLSSITSTDYNTLDNVRLIVSVPSANGHLFEDCLADWEHKGRDDKDDTVSFLVELPFNDDYLFSTKLLGYLVVFLNRLKAVQ